MDTQLIKELSSVVYDYYVQHPLLQVTEEKDSAFYTTWTDRFIAELEETHADLMNRVRSSVESSITGIITLISSIVAMTAVHSMLLVSSHGGLNSSPYNPTNKINHSEEKVCIVRSSKAVRGYYGPFKNAADAEERCTVLKKDPDASLVYVKLNTL